MSRGGRNKFDVAIYGATVGTNYGGLITYYALYRAIEKAGYSTIMIPPPSSDVAKSENHATRFSEEYLNLAERYPLGEFDKYNNLADTFVLGSDQIWNYKLFPGRKLSFYLDFVDEAKKKIAYAASFGFSKPTIFPEYKEKFPLISYLMKKIDYISVREEEGVGICKDYFEVPATHVMDPVFLLSADEYETLASKAKNKPEGRFMTIYALSPKDELNQAFQFVSQKLQLPRINMGSGNPRKYEIKKKNFDMPYCENLQMEEWLYNIKNSEFVITDSYHCVCFSIIFRKPFVLIQKSWAVSRIESLLKKLQLTDRWFTSLEELKNNSEILEKNIDYDSVYKILEKEICNSKNWLREALNSEKVFSRATEIKRDKDLIKSYGKLYRRKTINGYFRKLEKYKDDLIVVMSQKGNAGKYLELVKFFKSSDIGPATKKNMATCFAYIYDSENKTVKKKTGEFGHVSYVYEDVWISSISENVSDESKQKIAAIYIENKNERKIFESSKEGIYILIYSKKMKKVVDHVYLDTENDKWLRIERLL